MPQLAAALVNRNEHLDLAERLLVQVVRKDPNERVIFDLATVCRREGKYDESLRLLQHIEDNFPSYDKAKVLSGRADCFSNLNRYADALSVVEQTLALEPDNLKLQGRKAHLQIMLGRTDEALVTIDSVIRADPDNVIANSTKIHALVAAGRFSEAMPVLDRMLALNPPDASTHRIKANVLLKLGRNDEALAEIDTALTLNPGEISAHGLKAQTLLALGRYKECAQNIALLGEEAIIKNEYLIWMQAKAFGFEGDILHCKQRLLQLLNINPQPTYVMAFTAMVNRADKPEKNEIAVLNTLKGIFGEDKFRQIEHGAKTFDWGVINENTEDETFSREVSNSFWSGLYDHAVDSNARSVAFHPHSIPKDGA